MPSPKNAGPVLGGTEPVGRQQTTAVGSVKHTTPPRKPLDDALAYAAIGWHVFPCRQDKSPHTARGFHDATLDGDQIRRWWAAWPAAQVGIACGASGLVVVDLDVADDRDGVAAFDAIAGARHHGATLAATTPRGGRHLVYRADPARPAKCSSSRRGIDVRAHGGYIVAPSSASPGREWIEGEPGDKLAQVPDWIADLLKPAQDKPAAPMPGPSPAGAATDDELREVTSALFTVPSSLLRDAGWHRCILAVHAALSADPRGAELVERWSATSTALNSAGKPQYRAGEATAIYRNAVLPWQTPPGERQLVDRESLFRLAFDHGWAGRPAAPNATGSRPNEPDDGRQEVSVLLPFHQLLAVAVDALRADPSIAVQAGRIVRRIGDEQAAVLGRGELREALSRAVRWVEPQSPTKTLPRHPPAAVVEALAERRDGWALPTVRTADAPTLADLWQQVPDLDEPPEPIQYLLHHPTRDGQPVPPGVLGDGLLRRGILASLVGQGGAGKTMALLQLAASVATGARWLDHFQVPTTAGKVLLVLGEEDAAEAHRRLYRICRRMEPEERAELQRRVEVLSLRGAPRLQDGPSTLLEADPDRRDHWQPTAFSRALQAKLAAEPAGWSLIVVEPLSRLAGVDTDLSNHAATAVIGELERLTTAPGNPTVLVGIHSSKSTRNTSRATVRGASALTDGVRLEFALSVDEKGSRKLATTKSNYGRELRELRLVRDAFGVLRHDPTDGEPEPAAPETSFDSEIAAVVEALKAGPVANQKQLAKRMGKRPGNVGPALNEAVTRGLVRLAGTTKERRYEVATEGGENPPITPGNREPDSPDAIAGEPDPVPLVPGTGWEPVGTGTSDDGRPAAPGGRRRRKVVRP